ncbi:hypothetical protein, partial [Escherichia coli]|uniref:hypothetical protein n=1 Tax=Escherichia coli TaxID=562 RepID=UPI001954B16D
RLTQYRCAKALVGMAEAQNPGDASVSAILAVARCFASVCDNEKDRSLEEAGDEDAYLRDARHRISARGVQPL